MPKLARLVQARPWLLLFLVPWAIHWPALTGWLSADPIYLAAGLTPDWHSNGPLSGQPGWIDGNAGVTLEALGRLSAQNWAHLRIPWWNPYSGVGLPLAAEMQPAAFFLPWVLLLGLPGGLLLLKITMQMIAGPAMWGLLRQLGLARGAALLGGVLFQVSGNFAWDSDTSLLPIAFLPLSLWGIERALAASRAHAPGGWRMFGAAIAWSILAGFPETAYVDGLLAGLWALMRLPGAIGHRLGFLLRLACGSAAALLLCAPLLLAFAAYLGESGLATRNFGHTALLPGNLAMFLFPYASGPIFFGGMLSTWYRIGGFIGLPVLWLALLAACAALTGPARQRRLRILLLAWITLGLAKAAGLPGITEAWNAIPLIAQTLFYNYALPSWECAAIILAALAFDDILALSRAPGPHQLNGHQIKGLAASAACATLALLALADGRPLWHMLATVPQGGAWFAGAILWGAGCTLVIAASAALRRPGTMVAVLAIDAALQFTVPLLSGTRGDMRVLDLPAVGFLKQNLGLNRFYTLGPLSPNYGAFFNLAQVNHDYAPVSRDWISYVRANLDPQADAETFNGSFPPPRPGVETRPEALRRRAPAFAAIGVRYVLTRAGSNPFRLTPLSAHAPTEDAGPAILAPDQGLAASFPAGDFVPGPAPLPITAAEIAIGTFGNTATGHLTIALCTKNDCARGETLLDHWQEPKPLKIALNHALSLGAADSLDVRVQHEGGTTPVALWRWRAAPAPGRPQTGAMPILSLLPRDAPPLVFASNLTEIYELPNAAAYFSAPFCALAYTTRTEVHARCQTPSTLLRQELWFPGWSAHIGDRSATIDKQAIFQAVSVPEGDSDVRFSYAPPYVRSATAAAAVGALWVGVGLFKRRKKEVLF